jgi:hypothetical protein
MDIIAFLTPYPAWIKIALAIGVLCIFAAVVGMVFTPVPKSTAQTPAGGGTVNIISNDQKGGVTAHTVNTDKPK